MIVKQIIFSWFFFLLVGRICAQSTLKIGYTNADSIVLSLPETQGKLKSLESYTKQLSTQAEDKQKELQQKYEDYQANAADWIPEIVRQREQELQQLQEELVDFQQRAQRRVQEKQNKEFAPLYEKVTKSYSRNR